MRGPLGDRFEQRFGIVLLLLLVTFCFLAVEPTAPWTRPVIVLLQGATLVAALSAAGMSRRVTRWGAAITLLAVVVTAVSTAVNGSAGNILSALFNALLITVAPITIAWSMVRRRVVDARTVIGAVCIYILLGMSWAFVDMAVGTLSSQSFFTEQAGASTADYQYFSFITLTTVGYGDLTPATNLGRAFAVIEALMGQLYLVTVIALLVSNMGRNRPISAAAEKGPTGPQR